MARNVTTPRPHAENNNNNKNNNNNNNHNNNNNNNNNHRVKRADASVVGGLTTGSASYPSLPRAARGMALCVTAGRTTPGLPSLPFLDANITNGCGV